MHLRLAKHTLEIDYRITNLVKGYFQIHLEIDGHVVDVDIHYVDNRRPHKNFFFCNRWKIFPIFSFVHIEAMSICHHLAV